MKIGTGKIFNDYNKGFKERKLDLLKEKENYENSKQYLLDKLEPYKHYIINFTNIYYKHIKYLDRCISEKSLQRLVNLADVDIESIRRTINVIVQINKNLTKVNEELIRLESNILDEDVFKTIINTFNNKVSDKIVYNGYRFKIGGGLGIVCIKKVSTDKRIKKRINWHESNKKREELLLQGKLPFQVTERGLKREALKDNGGENWFVYFTEPFDYLWHWSKNNNVVLNSQYYKFNPTRYNNTATGGKLGNVHKLAQLKTSKSELLKNFI